MIIPLHVEHGAVARYHASRGVAPFVAASVALHVLLLLTLPETMRADVLVVPLEVTLQRIEPPRPLPMTPPEPPRVEKRDPPRPRPEPRVAQPVPRPEPPPPLVLPKPAAVPDPSFALPAPETRPAPEPPPVAQAPREGSGAAAKPEGTATARITPPVFTAAYLRNPEPVYPLSSRRRGEQGTVLLKVLVTRDGAASVVKVEETSGHVALDQAALEAVRRWRFAPARRGAEPVESSVLVPIVFRLEGVS